MMSISRALKVLIVGLGLMSLAPASVMAQSAPTEIIVGTSYPGPDAMPIYIAEQLGYFADEKLKVTLLSLATGDKVVFALLGGSIHIARYTPDWIIRAIEKGGKLKIVFGASNNLVFSLVGAKGINSYADLKGKRIGVSTIASADATLAKKMMAANGLGPTDYELIQSGSSPERAAALRAGSLGATLLTPPEDQKVLDDGPFKRLDLSTNVVKAYAWGGQSVKEDWAAANKPALVAYMRAWIKANKWLHDPANKAASIAILSREARMNTHYATQMYDLYFGPDSAPVMADGGIDVAGYKALLADMADQGQVSKPPPSPEKYIDASYIDAALKSLK